MARSAVLAGRTLADVVTNALSVVVLLVTGLIIGFSFDASLVEIVGGFGLLLLFGYAFSWIFALLGLIVSSPEAANSLGFIAVFPLTFISSAFVPVESMPAGLQWFAEINPFTIVVDAMRALWVGAPARQQRLGRGRVVARDHRGVRAAGRVALPARRGQLSARRGRAVMHLRGIVASPPLPRRTILR